MIGDVHGCFTVLDSYLKGRLEDDELYIFTGDMLDRGIENAKVVQFLLSIKDRKNVILLEGNHDKYLKQYGHDEETRSSVFNKKTKPELDKAGFDKKISGNWPGASTKLSTSRMEKILTSSRTEVFPRFLTTFCLQLPAS